MYKAKLSFWGEDKGGRITPPQTGYRPQIEIEDVHTSCTVTAIDNTVTVFDFDIEYVVKLDLMFKEMYGGKLKVGDSVKLYEGNKQIAEGIVIEEL